MTGELENLASRLLKREWSKLTAGEQKILKAIETRSSVVRNPICDSDARTFGERVADKMAAFGGSWTFLITFAVILVAWVVLNSYILANRDAAFDPYPYILLNLFLSMLASIQAPIIMMSQNRQAARDRIDATHDYEVNLKAELEIQNLHEKLDDLRDAKWAQLVEMQQQQIRLMEKLLREQIKTKTVGLY